MAKIMKYVFYQLKQYFFLFNLCCFALIICSLENACFYKASFLLKSEAIEFKKRREKGQVSVSLSRSLVRFQNWFSFKFNCFCSTKFSLSSRDLKSFTT